MLLWALKFIKFAFDFQNYKSIVLRIDKKYRVWLLELVNRLKLQNKIFIFESENYLKKDLTSKREK